MFNDARREGLIATNPAEAVKTFDVEKEARDVFTHEQLAALLASRTDLNGKRRCYSRITGLATRGRGYSDVAKRQF